jgi:hypothetical protein
MGNECSHSDLIIYEGTIIPKATQNTTIRYYVDPTKTWRFIVADCKCKGCGIKGRAVKKTCIDHKIAQPWKLITKKDCTHDVLQPYDYKYDQMDDTLRGRVECVVCKASVPAIAEFTTEYDANNKPILIVATKWSTDRPKYLDELKQARENAKQ